jgi:hypothetical protein
VNVPDDVKEVTVLFACMIGFTTGPIIPPLDIA